ncbi:MAG TPA: EI24 domain-containing protein [Burkholderiaceae bacterium]|nr:EI24 domain-containing protein [Burkholderiaceae bacterium]HSC00245.1 EI24 domain-containing protein [Burkholderiaceae bacterium]
MSDVVDAFWRATGYCLHPRVIGLSLLPLLICSLLSWLGWWLYWDAAVSAVQSGLSSWPLVGTMVQWVERWVGEGVRGVLAPAIVIALSLPAVVVVSVLLVGLLMTPAIVSLVERRRFPQLQRRHGAGIVSSVWVSLSSTLVALVLLLVSLPLWLVPPLILVLPPLIWGWLTYRVMSHDALAEHADAAERRTLMREHRWPLLAIGVVTGYLGAAPSLLWALNALTIVLAPLLIPLSVWLYTLVFAFSALWFVHYCLAQLERLRAAAPPAVSPPSIATPTQ